MNYPDLHLFWPALKTAIESLEKYYNKTDNFPMHNVSMCVYFAVGCTDSQLTLLTLILTHADEYLKAAWNENGQKYAQKTMEKVVEFLSTINQIVLIKPNWYEK